jgi:hypothetical protein
MTELPNPGALQEIRARKEQRERVAKARAFGGFLYQEWSPLLKEASLAASQLAKDHPELADDINTVHPGVGSTLNFIRDLRSAPDINFQYSDGGADFIVGEYNPQTKKPEAPQEGTYQYTDKEYALLMSALNHNINNAIAPALGFAELISLDEDFPELATISSTLGKVQNSVISLMRDSDQEPYIGIEISVEKGKPISVQGIASPQNS